MQSRLNPPPKVLYIKKEDLVDYKTTHMEIKLAQLFDGEYVRNNDGTHLDGGIVDDKICQLRYKRIIVYPLSQYGLPFGTVGRLSVRKFSDELDGVLERKGNMERFLCFMSMILPVSPDIKGATNVRRRLKQGIIKWEESKF